MENTEIFKKSLCLTGNKKHRQKVLFFKIIYDFRQKLYDFRQLLNFSGKLWYDNPAEK